jgi:hypothetical protein
VWREAYTLATISCALEELQASVRDTDRSHTWITRAKACLRKLDVAILVGGPRMVAVVHSFIKILHLSMLSSSSAGHIAPSSHAAPAASKRISNSIDESASLVAETQWNNLKLPISQRLRLLEPVNAPDLLRFESQYMEEAQPCLMNGVAGAWPAMERCASGPCYTQDSLHVELPFHKQQTTTVSVNVLLHAQRGGYSGKCSAIQCLVGWPEVKSYPVSCATTLCHSSIISLSYHIIMLSYHHIIIHFNYFKCKQYLFS